MNIGKWNLEEHKLYLEGLKLFGKNFVKIQMHIKTRTIIQIRTHHQKMKKKKCDKIELLYKIALIFS